MFDLDKTLKFLYGNALGREVLKVLVRPCFSNLGGDFMDSRLSKVFIRPFVRKNHIDLSICKKTHFRSYNDFFTRKLKASARPVSKDRDVFVSPCDSRLTVYDIEDTDRAKFMIKDTEYTLESLLRNKELARKYKGGKLWLFRLSVDDYHRYIYPFDGYKSYNCYIKGFYHTVNPIANDYLPIYKENTREYCLIKTKEAKTILMMEVGAMLVGRIENEHYGKRMVRRGMEKGHFAYGGSTIIVLTQKDAVSELSFIAANSRLNRETRVLQGQIVGELNK